MASTTFVDGVTTIVASWLNDVNTAVYTTLVNILSGSTAVGHATLADTATTVTNGVYTTGNQTIGGIKTFSSPPTVPTPVATTDAANKTYVDSLGKRVAQVVTFQTGAVMTGSNPLPIDNTIPQNTEGDQYLSVSITPTNSSSTLEIDAQVFMSNSNASVNNTIALFQDSTANALGVMSQLQATANGFTSLALKYVMTAGTTSATTFKIRAGHATGTTTINGQGGTQYFAGSIQSRITVKEILP